MNQAVLGIDVSKETLDVVLMWEGGQHHEVVDNTASGFACLSHWLGGHKVGQVQACLEATGQYGEGVAEYLYQQGHGVSIVNPARIKRYGDSKLHRNKTDKADAALIAEFCRKEQPAPWKPLPDCVKDLRQLVRRLDDLQTNYQQERNRLQSGVRQAEVIADIQEHLLYLKQRIQTLQKTIQALIQSHAELRKQQDLLVSIPGVGKLTAARLLAEIGDIRNFSDAPQLAAYAGLNPKGFRSGKSVFKKTRISKEGRAFLRYILYMPALVSMRFNPIIRAFCDRLSKRNLPKMAIVAAAMRKLLHLVFGILKSQRPFDPAHLAHATFAS
jgi:transposase